MSELTALGIWLTVFSVVVLAIYAVICASYWNVVTNVRLIALLALPFVLFLVAVTLIYCLAELRLKYIAANRREKAEAARCAELCSERDQH